MEGTTCCRQAIAKARSKSSIKSSTSSIPTDMRTRSGGNANVCFSNTGMLACDIFAGRNRNSLVRDIRALVYATQGLEVDSVSCHGKILLRDKKFTQLKPEPIYKKAAAYRKKISSFLE